MRDMTKGSPAKIITTFAVPMLIGNIFQQVYNVVDTVIVGHFLGAEQLAGVGSAGTLTSLLLSFVFGLCNGAGLVAAQCFGSKNMKRLQQAVVALIWVGVALTAAVSALGFFAAPFFLKLLAVPENVIGYSLTYIRIIYVFAIGNVAYNGASALLRSVGDSRTPLYALIASSLTNAALDVAFVVKCGLGVRGAAYATVIAQALSAVITVRAILHRRSDLGLVNMDWHPDKSAIAMIVRTGFPGAFQSCTITLGVLLVQRLINSYGSSVMAAYVAANRVDSVALQVIVSIGTSLSVFTGQNMGTGDFARIREGMYKTLAIMLAASIAIAILVMLFRYPLMRLFLDEGSSADIIEIGATYLAIIGASYVVAGIMQSYQNVIRGAGDVNVCMIAGLTELSGRIFFAYLLSHFIGVTGIWIATPLSYCCGCVIPVIRYYSGKWKAKKLV